MNAQPGDTVVLTLDRLLDQVRQFHPTARRADLSIRSAQAGILAARAAFDPKLGANIDRKSFDGSTYYSYGYSEIKMPTILGVNVKTAFEATEGIFLNPEATLPSAGQAIFGVELPLLRGLWIDEPRYQFRTAQQERVVREAEAVATVNDLQFDATKAYFNWVYTYYAAQITERVLVASLENYRAVAEGYETGDQPAIDTLEAILQVQSHQVDRDQALVDLENATAMLSVYLWNADGQMDRTNWRPEPPEQSFLPVDFLATASQRIFQHPQLRSSRAKLEQLSIEERWKREQFKPQLDFEYNFLGDGFRLVGEDNPLTTRNLLLDNYKLGVQFSIPLFWRKARAGLEQTELKIADTDWQLRQKEQDLRAKLAIYQQRFETISNQIQTFQSAVDGYGTLLEAEREIFRLGESSVFLLNSRIQKLLEAELKLLKLQTELRKAEMGLRWSTASF